MIMFPNATLNTASQGDSPKPTRDDDIVKEFHIQSDFDVSTDPAFMQALGNRIACGGTSHFKVFSRIAELIKSKTIDPSKTLYCSFSDNYSDIPKSWKATPVMTKLYSTTFLAPEHNPMSIPGTTDISMSQDFPSSLVIICKYSYTYI